jgi:hypothetical protein
VCVRPGTPLSLDDGLRLVQGHVERQDTVRVNSASGDIAPKDMLAGRKHEISARETESGITCGNNDGLVASEPPVV